MMKIKYVKIFGERNSGTTYLYKLLENNLIDVKLCNVGYDGGTGWKHGVPKMELFNEEEEFLFIFIVRELESWLKSMYKNQYNFKKIEKIEDFLIKKLESNDRRMLHDMNVNKEIEEQDVMSVRYSKLRSFLDFYEDVSNGIFVNMSYLQENEKKFVEFLMREYGLGIRNKFRGVKTHTKSRKIREKNRVYDVKLPLVLIRKDEELENEVEKLKAEMKYKNGSKI